MLGPDRRNCQMARGSRGKDCVLHRGRHGLESLCRTWMRGNALSSRASRRAGKRVSLLCFVSFQQSGLCLGSLERPVAIVIPPSPFREFNLFPFKILQTFSSIKRPIIDSHTSSIPWITTLQSGQKTVVGQESRDGCSFGEPFRRLKYHPTL